MRVHTISLVVAASMMASGCASTPRPFVADVQPAPADQSAYNAIFLSCADEVASGRRENFQTGAEDGQAAGLVTGAAGTAMIYAGASAGWSGFAAMGAGAGLVVLAPLVAVGVTSAVRSNRERAIQRAMSACLQQNGYTVADWRRVSESEAAAGVLTTPTAPRIAQPAPEPSPQE